MALGGNREGGSSREWKEHWHLNMSLITTSAYVHCDIDSLTDILEP